MPKQHDMKAYRENVENLHAFFILAHDGGACFTPLPRTRAPDVHWTGSWADRTASLDTNEEKILFLYETVLKLSGI